MPPTGPRPSIEAAAALYRAGRVDEAHAAAQALLSADPRDFNALHLLGTIAVQRGDAEDCVALYDRALAIVPGHAEAHGNRGIAWRMLGQPALALEDYGRAIEADPRSFNALTLRGVLFAALGRESEARADYERALALNPRHAPAIYNRGLLDLAQGRYAAGFNAYELRFSTTPPTSIHRSFGLPRLRPEDLGSGRRVAIWREQGLGDQILFSTLLPELAARGVQPVVDADPRLLATFRRSLPQVEFVPPDASAKAFASCALELPLGSLPWLLRRDAASFARQPRALLRADPDRVAALRARPGLASAVAISWRSFQVRQRRLFAEVKSMPLEAFARLAAAGRALLDLQYGEVDAERAEFDARHPNARMALDADLYNDIESVLAAIEASAAVVTTSNVTAHFAGALGKRTFLLYLGPPPFHYWAPRDGRSPWYPSVEILADARWTSWDEALDAAVRRLEALPAGA